MTKLREEPRRTRQPSAISIFEATIAVLAVVVQQEGAFVSVPATIAGDSLRGVVNPINTIAVALSIGAVGLVCLPRIREIASLAVQNGSALLFMLLVLGSAAWSIHPDLTVRRGIGYVLTMMIAAYLTVRFDADDRMRIFSASFAISAIGSLVFVAVLPQYGIMQGGDLAGAWRGVFPHKNVLGPVMATAVFTELYLLVRFHGRPFWRWTLVTTYLALVILSHSATAWFLALLYFGGAAAYVVWRRQRLAGGVAIVVAGLVLLGIVVAFWSDPGPMLSLIGKDETLTGRTTLWQVVLGFIREKPVFGWGYHAMWQLDDPTTTLADRLTGNWGVTSSHNTFLELTLQLGIAGLGLMLVVVGGALRRGVRCCQEQILPLGWFSVIFVVGAVGAAQVIETLGQNQVVEWLLFNVLAFGCGIELVRSRAAKVSRLVPRVGSEFLVS